ncbi:MAG: hypothetical protein AAF799_24870 [Myxococcota bacterium]
MAARRLGWLVAMAAMMFACSGQSASTPSGGVPAGAPDSTARPDPASCRPEQMRACFGELKLVAGTARIERKGVDGWKAEYEAGPALQAELSRPHFVMADATGNLFVADKDAQAVRKIDPAGTIVTVAGAPELKSPNGLWVAGTGVVYILDLGHSAIQRLDARGTLTTLFEVPQGISIGRGLWVSDDETRAFVASNTEVLRWSPQAGVQVYASGFRSLGNLALDLEGRLVVTDRRAGRVFRLAADGTATPIAGTGESSGGGDGSAALRTALPGVRALWFDASGGYFLGTHESDTVWFVDPSGTIQRFAGAPQLSEVRGLSLDAQGNLLVVDHDGGRIWRAARRP